jgi:transcriptional regulator with XRE-family HTH domain
VDARILLRDARSRAGLSQRELAGRAGVAQPAIARIESGVVSPRVDTLDRLLERCEVELDLRRRLGAGIDRTQIRRILVLTPAERLRLATKEGQNMIAFLEAARPS